MRINYKPKWRHFVSALFVVTSFGAFSQTQFPVQIAAGAQGNTNNGTGSATDMDPVDVFFQSFRYQTVFTVAELNAAGVFGGKITSFGWFVTQLPSSALNGYTIKIGHTTATDAAVYNADPTTVVKNPFSFLPATNTAYNDIVLDAPFVWNGTSNLLIEVCTSGNTSAANFGGMRGRTGVANSSNFVGGATDQCASPTTTVGSVRPYIRLTIENPATPPVPVQDPATPTCLTGSSLTVAGSAPAGETWYWQTTATGTSMATPVSGPYAITDNGTFYVRSYSTASHIWSTASSITVNNFVHPAAPTAITQVTNPACVTTGTDLTVAAPVSPDEAYFWQGTTANGTSNANPATAPFHAAASGTYHVSTYNTVTGCWSTTSTSLAVTINSYFPAAPTATPASYTVCTGTPSVPVVATPPPGGPNGTASQTTGAISVAIPDATTAGLTNILNLTTVPVGATVTSVAVTVNITHTWDADVDLFLVGPNGTQIELTTDNGGSGDNFTNTVFTNTASTAITAGAAPFTGSFLPEGNLTTLFSVPNGDWKLLVQDDAGGDFGTLTSWTIAVTYTQNPASTISWYDAATAGTQVGTGSPLESVGTTVLPNTSAAGAYNFFAQSNSGGCVSATRTQVTVNVSAVLAVLTPVNATCNGLNNGSFTLGAITCGVEPFTYSIDGGTTFGNIPTNLLAGTYNVIIKDAGDALSSPITVVITEPSAPTSLNATASYYTASLGWTAQGNEADWVVEWGPAGFTPGTGTLIDPATNPQPISGLTASTMYDFYVAAGCAAGSDVAGPFTFTTDTPFSIFDGECGPGFNDISGTGTLLDFSGDVSEFFEDEAETGVTLPFTWNFQGIAVTTMSVGYNGGVALNTLTGEVAGGIVPAPGLSLYNADLDVSNVYTQTVGVAPNRQFIVQWNDAPMYLGTNGATFQLVIQENSADYFFLYNDVIMDDADFEDYGADAEIGIRGPLSNLTVSMNDQEYLMENSCIRFTTQLCPNPMNLDIDAEEELATLDWDAGQYGETEWTVIYGPAGFDLEGGEAIDTIVTSASGTTLAPLAQNTQYDVYIFSECALDGLTSDGLMGTFTTLPFCTTPTTLTAATDVDSLEAGWNWTTNPNVPGYDIVEFNIQYGMTGFELGTGMMHTADGDNNTDTVYNTTLLSGGVYQYYIQAVCTDDTVSGWAGPITFTMPLANDVVCSAETLVVDGPVYTFNNTGATVAAGEAAIAPPADGAQSTEGWVNQTLNGTVWFKFVAPASGSIRINATGINYNGQAAVYAVNSCSNFGTFALQAANDDAIGGTSLAPNFTVCGLTSGTTYYLMFDGFNGTTGNYNLAITSINLEAGAANTDPLTLDVCSGADVDLFSTITGEQTGGVWTSSIPAVNASITGSTLGTEGLAYTTYNIQYRVTDGCAYDSILGKVKVFAPSNAGEDGIITACRNEPVNLLNGLDGNADLGGTWYTPGGTPTTDGADITAANTQGNYNYTYITGNGVCPNDTALVVVSVSGTCNELSVSEEMFAGVEVFPNPSAGIVFVTSDSNFSYEVTDANGRVVTSAKNGVKAAQKTEINLNNVERGVYFIRLNNESAQKTYRIVIN